MTSQVRFTPGDMLTFFDKLEILTDELIAADTSASADIIAAQDDATDALTNAAAAQTTANTGVTNAATAQTTANTAVTNAATAQTTANTGVTNAATANSLIAAGYRMVRGTYRFASQGGAVGNINLKNDAGTDLILPNKAIIIQTFIATLIEPGSLNETATLSISVEAPSDIASGIFMGYLTTTSFAAGEQTGLPDEFLITTSAKTPTLTVATEDLTLGSIDVYFGYIVGN